MDNVTSQLASVVTSLSLLRMNWGVLESELATSRSAVDSLLTLATCIGCLGIDPSRLISDLDLNNVRKHKTPSYLTSFHMFFFYIFNLFTLKGFGSTE